MLPRRAMLMLGAAAALSGCGGPWLPTEDAAGTRTPLDGCAPTTGGGRVLCGDPDSAWPSSYVFHGRIAVAQDGRVAAGHSGRVAVWDPAGRLLSVGGAVDGYGGLAWAGDWLAAARCDGSVDLIDPGCGLSTLTLTPGRAFSPGLAGSQEGRVYASTLDVVSCWDAATGEHLVSRQLQEALVWGCVPAGLLISQDWSPLLLDPVTLETVWTAAPNETGTESRHAWAASADASALVGVSHGAVPLLRIDGVAREAGALGSDGAVPAVSADGGAFAWVSVNDGVWLADRTGGTVALPRPGAEVGGIPPRKFASLAFSPDGGTLYALGFTGVARWDVRTHEYLGALESPPSA